MAKVAGSEACALYFSVMEMGEDPTEGVTHAASLAAYGGGRNSGSQREGAVISGMDSRRR